MAHYPDLEANLAGVSYIGKAEAEAVKRPGLYRVFSSVPSTSWRSCSAPFVLPILLILGFMIARDGGPVLYCQNRIGRGGRIFRIWKLRTMVINADAALEDYLASDPAARAEWNEHQKLRKDPRITPAGRLIRKTSLDELPQLWNVLTGDMSLVGPRPMMPSQTRLYPGRAYYRLRPGLTGFWQISHRNETPSPAAPPMTRNMPGGCRL